MNLNSHSYGVNPERFATDEGLTSFYRLKSVSYEPGNIPEDARSFTATVEACDYSFFATGFHPEKTLEMYDDNSGVNHS